MNTKIFPSILDLPVPAQPQTHTHTNPAKGLSLSVLTTVLAHPKSFPFLSQLQGNKGTGKEEQKEVESK